MEELLKSNDPFVWISLLIGGLITLRIIVQVIQMIIDAVLNIIEALIDIIATRIFIVITFPFWFPIQLIENMILSGIGKNGAKSDTRKKQFPPEHGGDSGINSEQKKRKPQSQRKKETTGNEEIDWALCLLGLPLNNNFTMKELNREFRIMANECHPDKGNGDTELMQELYQARIIVKKWRSW